MYSKLFHNDNRPVLTFVGSEEINASVGIMPRLNPHAVKYKKQVVRIRIFCIGDNVAQSSLFSTSRKNVSMAEERPRDASKKYKRRDSLDNG